MNLKNKRKRNSNSLNLLQDKMKKRSKPLKKRLNLVKRFPLLL